MLMTVAEGALFWVIFAPILYINQIQSRARLKSLVHNKITAFGPIYLEDCFIYNYD